MLVCKRCQGFINTTYREYFDPSCINCGCSYPELGASENGTRPRKQLKETIRYTGSIPDRKELLGYITYSQHPNVGHVSPRLVVECPICTEKSEVLSSQADPSSSRQTIDTVFVKGYRTARQPITCPTGHSFRLKINEKGVYSWAE